jgi:hypothetical protein
MKTSPHARRTRIPLKVWLPIVIGLIVAGGIAVWIFIALPHSEKEQQIRNQSAAADQLYSQHQACVKKLDQDFKALDDTNQEAYQKAYDACEKIREEQNKAVDEYNKLLAT